ncbi:hypothetical protein E8E13_000981 [Curvularia kusanoi]|uniref:FAD-binding domain-containing protein n=1 Tax=Curvularia kusanoi TaxID=90978 RepID=A0A9P4T3W5_CURKU|nr:hypothetical protein E8E13_000981 [Curvularia kusanoi]
MSDQKRIKILIAGGSVAGLTLANIFEKLELDYLVLEKYERIAPELGASIGIFPNGFRILDQLGCYDAIKDLIQGADAFQTLNVRNEHGQVISELQDASKTCNERLGYEPIFVDRQMLIQILYDNLRDKSKVLTKRGVIKVDQTPEQVLVTTDDGNLFCGDVLVGADGIHSTVRREMWRLADEHDPGLFPVVERLNVPTEYCCIFGISRSNDKMPKYSSQNIQGQEYSHLIGTGPEDRIYWFLFKKLPQVTRGLHDKIPRFTDEQRDAMAAEHAGDLFNPIGVQGGNSAIEDAAVLANELHALFLASNTTIPNETQISQALEETQRIRFPRALKFLRASHKTQSIQAQDTFISRFVARYVMPFSGPGKILERICEGLTARDRALRYYHSLAPGPAKLGQATEAYKDIDELAYALSKVPTFTPRPIKIIAIGAGFSGLSLARAVRSGKLPNATITIYEKNAGLGGTWYENRYPGCACDIPAPNYQFSWAPSPFWKSYYASGPEIQSYIESVADQHDLRRYIKTGHKATKAEWVEERQTWRITINTTDGRDLIISSQGVTEGETSTNFTDECDVFVNCSGFFNNWKWPQVADRDKFQGNLYHTAAWPEGGDKDLEGKIVALIGNGSSGVQVLPAIIDRVKKVYVHIRSPTWITTNFAAKFAGPGGANYDYTEEQKATWASDPSLYLEYRRQIEEELNSRFRLYIDHTPEQKAAREFGLEEMALKLKTGGQGELFEKMVPDFAVGCTQNYSYVVPKPHVAPAYQKHALAWLARTVWSSHCSTS